MLHDTHVPNCPRSELFVNVPCCVLVCCCWYSVCTGQWHILHTNEGLVLLYLFIEPVKLFVLQFGIVLLLSVLSDSVITYNSIKGNFLKRYRPCFPKSHDLPSKVLHFHFNFDASLVVVLLLRGTLMLEFAGCSKFTTLLSVIEFAHCDSSTNSGLSN